MSKRILFFILFSWLASAAFPAFAQQTGDIVWAEWQTNGWYHGTVGEPCGAGFTVNFDDALTNTISQKFKSSSFEQQ